MEIKCGEYILKSDSMNLWIEKEFISKKGKNAGKTATRVVSGYHRDFEHLLDDFAMRRVRGSDAKSVTELLKDIMVIESDLRDLAKELETKLNEVK